MSFVMVYSLFYLWEKVAEKVGRQHVASVEKTAVLGLVKRSVPSRRSPKNVCVGSNGCNRLHA